MDAASAREAFVQQLWYFDVFAYLLSVDKGIYIRGFQTALTDVGVDIRFSLSKKIPYI